MHPFALYLAAVDGTREHGSATGRRGRAAWASIDAEPILEPEPASRFRRLTSLLRRRILRTAGA